MVWGVVAYHAAIFLLSRFAVVTLPDGNVTTDDVRTWILYGILLVVTLLVGGFIFFHGMTRKEIFCSASIVVLFDLITDLISRFVTGTGAVVFYYIAQIYEWRAIVPMALYQINLSPLIISIISALVPYLFVLFGKRPN